MELNLNGKHAVVCGSTQGIGKAAAIELAKLGARITLVSRNEQKLVDTLRELPVVDGIKHGYFVADSSKPETWQQYFREFAATNAVDILVNNSGGPAPGPALDADPESYVQAFTAHLIANQILTQAVVPQMKVRRWGRIVNIISTSVKIPLRGLGVSNTIRGAVANWSKTLSFELAPYGITVNNVLPGATMTGRLEQIIARNAEKKGISFEEEKQNVTREIPAGRIADPSEVAAAIAFLASPAAGYINGINVPVDGGRTGTL